MARVPVSEVLLVVGLLRAQVVGYAHARDLGLGRSRLGRGLLAAASTAVLLGAGRGNGVSGRAVLVREGDADRLVHDVAGHHEQDDDHEEEGDQDRAGRALLAARGLGVDLLILVVIESREAAGEGLGRDRCRPGNGLRRSGQDIRDRVRRPRDLDVGVVGGLLLRSRRLGLLRIRGRRGRCRGNRGRLHDGGLLGRCVGGGGHDGRCRLRLNRCGCRLPRRCADRGALARTAAPQPVQDSARRVGDTGSCGTDGGRRTCGGAATATGGAVRRGALGRGALCWPGLVVAGHLVPGAQ